MQEAAQSCVFLDVLLVWLSLPAHTGAAESEGAAGCMHSWLDQHREHVPWENM